MPNVKRSLAAAIALASLSSPFASANEPAFSQVIAFGDSLTDVGNAGIFTSGDDKQAAISIMSQQLGLGPVTPSCAGLSLCLPEVNPALSPEELLASAQAQVQAALPNVGGGWAVGGHRAADVLLNILGTEGYFNYLAQNGMTLDVNDHNFVSALLPDPTRETSTGLYPDLNLLGAFLAGDPNAAAAIVADSGITGNPHPLGLGYLETTAGRADGKALYWVNGGGNDLLGGFQAVLGGSITQAQFGEDIGTAANMLADGANALSAAGANYILVSNVPDISSTPGMFAAVSQAVLASPEAAQLADAVAAGLITQAEADAQLAAAVSDTLSIAGGAVDAFNSTLMAAAGDIDGVLLVDQNGVLKVSLANAGTLGFASGFQQTQFCYDGSGGCIEHPVYGINGTNPDDSQLIFNDAVHPTQAAQNMLADYYTGIVNAAQVAGQLPDIGVQAARTHTNTLEENLLGARYSDAQTGVFVGGVFGNTDYSSGFAPNLSGDGSGGILGATYALRSNTELGFALSRSDISLDNAQSVVDSTSTNYSVFGRFHYDVLFVDASVTMTDVDYDNVSRAFRLGSSFNSSLDADTSGENLSLSMTAGANILTGPTRLGPFANVTRATVEVEGYTEDAIDGFTYTDASGTEQDPFGMHFASQERRYTTMRVGGFASHSWDSISAYGQLWYEDTTGTDDDSLEVGIKSMGGNMNAMPSYASEGVGLFEDGAGAMVGLRWQAASRLAVSANLTARPTSETGSISVNYLF
ncbi:autotransporter domain-containing protein [Microbulbifer flavimaris]|uniref:Autotransporter domain-containing protein n=1 Tax=Microbulbifer flavimaris TaxID=1781068 RepID=A0ABX4HX27_9GAMM|nr:MULTISPECIES: autotransporter domain-containing protein [Microbulbifer]KUJ82456.1 autotransporter [Microbulbifer sp. ZGT114]PCO04662.1 autotransporter domain-containing protein [Microbulbifer flavimaris]